MKHSVKQLAILAAMLVSTFALAAEFPSAPPNLKEVEAQGLVRVNAEELKGLFPGVIDAKGPTGRHLITHNADGTCLRKAAKRAVGTDASGTWRIVEKNNTYCRSLPKMGRGVMAKGGYEEHCFSVFRAADGVHYFDYDVDDGFFAHVWRRAEGQ
jgi:hypothetical protein